jgi:hypothetical protein
MCPVVSLVCFWVWNCTFVKVCEHEVKLFPLWNRYILVHIYFIGWFTVSASQFIDMAVLV